MAEVRTSPLRRARDTAELLALGPPVAVDERWVEVDYGEFECRPLHGIPAEVWQRWRNDRDFRPEGGETLAEVDLRVAAACEELFALDGAGARNPDGDVVVVSHVTPIKAAVAWALGHHRPLLAPPPAHRLGDPHRLEPPTHPDPPRVQRGGVGVPGRRWRHNRPVPEPAAEPRRAPPGCGARARTRSTGGPSPWRCSGEASTSPWSGRCTTSGPGPAATSGQRDLHFDGAGPRGPPGRHDDRRRGGRHGDLPARRVHRHRGEASTTWSGCRWPGATRTRCRSDSGASVAAATSSSWRGPSGPSSCRASPPSAAWEVEKGDGQHPMGEGGFAFLANTCHVWTEDGPGRPEDRAGLAARPDSATRLRRWPRSGVVWRTGPEAAGPA